MLYLIFLIPVMIMLDFYFWSFITSLMTTDSDIAVTIGVVMICAMAAGHYFLILFIKNKFKV